MCRAATVAAVAFFSCIHASPDTYRLQTAVVRTSTGDLYGTYAKDPLSSNTWGGDLPDQDMALQGQVVSLRALSPAATFACQASELINNTALQQKLSSLTTSRFILVVERGNCTFTEKALAAQQIGAAAVIIADTVEAIYNTTVRENGSKYDKGGAFDCSQGSAVLPSIESPPWSDLNNAATCNTSPSCASQRCIPTGSGNQVCCMWDVADYLGYGMNADQVTIPVVRIRVADASKLGSSSVILFKRFVPRVDLAQVLIWLMAVATIVTAGYYGATFERKKATAKRVHATSSSGRVPAAVHAALRQEQMDEPALDMGWVHAVAFLVFGSGFLLLLFYVNVVMVVIVLFCFGATSAVGTILLTPLLHRVSAFRGQLYAADNAYLGPIRITVSDVLSFGLSLGLVLFWVLTRHQDYSFVLQDVFGICVSIQFLQTIRLPNIKVATILLLLVFVYDIFFVFLSPYIFGKSVMIVAAQGGKQDDAEAPSSYCLRYPSNDNGAKCVKEDIPILLRLPKLTNWLGGEAMLGLGDIVLPGLLVVFCARFDYATRGNVVGTPRPGSFGGRVGLFGMMCVGYAVGLLLANIGVILMRSGQPALLYLVPCTLGVLVVATWRTNRLLRKLWDGPTEFNQLPEVELPLDTATTTASAVPYAIPMMEEEEQGGKAYTGGDFASSIELYSAALDALENEVQRSPPRPELQAEKAKLLSNRAAALVMVDKVQEALHDSIASVQLDRTYLRAHLRVAKCWLLLGKTKDAREAYRHVDVMLRDLDPSRHHPQLEKYQAQWHEGHVAVRSLESLVRQFNRYTIANDTEAALRATEAAMVIAMASRELRVEEYCTGLVRNGASGGVTSLGIEMAVLYCRALHYDDKSEKALEELHQLLRAAPTSVDVLSVKRLWELMADVRLAANDAFKRGDYSRAELLYTKALSLDDNHRRYNASILGNRAAAYMALNQYDKAIKDCNAALQYHPVYFKCYYTQNHYKESVADFDEYMAKATVAPDDLRHVRRERDQVQKDWDRSKYHHKAKTTQDGELFKDMSAAYAVLSDEQLKATYDKELRYGGHY
ncbi:hypothetical protein DYB31_000551 [Aphanomyces astaci]|uniref:PA domain-containing protein n=1 Tax=Aphanomyces astaci TaxID=112090 RepID=A0A397EQR0_APHAT|nr:hypothetical protein DYB31_000551 [Aphanomyces astaci]